MDDNFKRAKEISKQFRKLRNQDTSPDLPRAVTGNCKRRGNNVGEPWEYRAFMHKYDNLSRFVDKFTPRDLCYYFKVTAEGAGYKFFIAYGKHMAQFKRLRNTYSNREICGMVDFLYNSGQDYLEKSTLSPSILASGWVGRIYRDTRLWLDNKYSPSGGRKNPPKGEWSGGGAEASSSDVQIGGGL